MLYVLFTPFISGALISTLIIPKKLLNHRLTYINGPKVVNSAVYDNTRIDDYFGIAEQITHLPNAQKLLCSVNKSDLFVCNDSDDKRVLFKIKDSTREVRFQDVDGNCLTVDDDNDPVDDSYAVKLSPCENGDSSQIFILNKDHGHIGEYNTIDRFNIGITTKKAKKNFRDGRSPLRMTG